MTKTAITKVRQEFSATRMAERFEAVLLEATGSAA
jgi:hypothetical protein